MKYLKIIKELVEDFYANELVGEALRELASRIDDDLVQAFRRAMHEAGQEATREDEADFRDWLTRHSLDGRGHINTYLTVLV